jgi:hypothetical protein
MHTRSNEAILWELDDQKTPYLFTSEALLKLLEVTTSVKTKITMIAMLGPRLVDPKSKMTTFLDIFRYAEEKARVEEILKARASTLSSAVFKQTTAIAPGAGRGRGGAGRGTGLLGGRGTPGSGRGSSKPTGSSSSLSTNNSTNIQNSSNIDPVAFDPLQNVAKQALLHEGTEIDGSRPNSPLKPSQISFEDLKPQALPRPPVSEAYMTSHPPPPITPPIPAAPAPSPAIENSSKFISIDDDISFTILDSPSNDSAEQNGSEPNAWKLNIPIEVRVYENNLNTSTSQESIDDHAALTSETVQSGTEDKGQEDDPAKEKKDGILSLLKRPSRAITYTEKPKSSLLIPRTQSANKLPAPIGTPGGRTSKINADKGFGGRASSSNSPMHGTLGRKIPSNIDLSNFASSSPPQLISPNKSYESFGNMSNRSIEAMVTTHTNGNNNIDDPIDDLQALSMDISPLAGNESHHSKGLCIFIFY